MLLIRGALSRMAKTEFKSVAEYMVSSARTRVSPQACATQRPVLDDSATSFQHRRLERIGIRTRYGRVPAPGGMFAFIRKKLVGSYSFFSATNRAHCRAL